MNTDIRISVSFKGHRKRKRLKKLLGPDAVLALIDLWIGVAMSNPTGMLEAWDEHDLALEAGWEGDSLEFVSALVDCKFLDVLPEGGFKMHDWEEHQGYVVHAEERSDRAKRAAKARWGKKEKQQDKNKDMPGACSEHCSEHNQAMLSDANSNAPSPTPTPTPTPAPIAVKDIVDQIPPDPPKPAQKRFVPPTIEQVSAYCLERNNDVEPQRWLDHYTSNGWRVGKNPMKDWKAAVRTWEGKVQPSGYQVALNAKIPRPVTVNDALVLQRNEIARTLNDLKAQQRADAGCGENGGVLVESPVS